MTDEPRDRPEDEQPPPPEPPPFDPDPDLIGEMEKGRRPDENPKKS